MLPLTAAPRIGHHLASGAAALTLSIRVWIESDSGIDELTCPVPLWSRSK